MPKFHITEVREIVSEGKITAKNAQEAVHLFKRLADKTVHSCTEEVNTTATEIKEEE